MELKDIYNLVNKKDGLDINKQLIKQANSLAAMVFADLQEKNNGAFFECSVNYIKKEYNLKQDRQLKIFNKLKNLGLIEIKYQGMPRTRYVKVNKEVWLYGVRLYK